MAMANSETLELSGSDSDIFDSDEDETECFVELAAADCSSSQATLMEVLEKILQEDLITNSSLGGSVSAIVQRCLQEIKSPKIENFAIITVQEMQLCCDTGKKQKIPLSRIWRNFHVLRLSSAVKSAWNSCIVSFQLAEASQATSDLTLQVILKRMFQVVVKQMVVTQPVSNLPVETLTQRENNAIQYMAGYVVVKAGKKYRQYSEFFKSLCIQNGFNFTGIDTVHDYVRVWTEQVDRGGLCHANETFFNLLIAIEYICRKYLDIRITPGNNIMEKIKQEAFQSSSITQMWDEIAVPSIPPDVSGEILKFIVKLWANIRIHSFAEKWTDLLGKTHMHSKSTRKTLKRKGTEKEST